MSLRQRTLARAQKIISSRKPNFIVGEEDAPYMRRWYITPAWLRPLGAIYLHEFCRDDDDVPHDHPYLFNISWILSVGYFEHQFTSLAKRMARCGIDPDYREDLICKWRKEGSVIARWGWTSHRVQLKVFRLARMVGISYVHGAHPASNAAINEFVNVTSKPLTLFFCGPRVREWGFYCPQGWKVWREYIATTSYGNRIGKGCEE